jgi:hypothetical protein
VPAGVVRVQFAGVPEDGTAAELIDAVTGTAGRLDRDGGRRWSQLDSIRATATAPVTDPALAPGALT